MAHHHSAKKRIRQTARRTEVNRARVSRVRTFIKRTENLIESGDKEQAAEAFRSMQKVLQHGVTQGIVPKNTASRKLSRLSKKIKGLGS